MTATPTGSDHLELAAILEHNPDISRPTPHWHRASPPRVAIRMPNYFANSPTHCGADILRFLKETTVNLCLCRKGKEKRPNLFYFFFRCLIVPPSGAAFAAGCPGDIAFPERVYHADARARSLPHRRTHRILIQCNSTRKD